MGTVGRGVTRERLLRVLREGASVKTIKARQIATAITFCVMVVVGQDANQDQLFHALRVEGLAAQILRPRYRQ